MWRWRSRGCARSATRKGKMKQETKKSCMCKECLAACLHKPGWFLPGEAERVASYFKILLEELFETKLAVDWWSGNPDIFLLSPAIIGNEAGTEFPGNPRGSCVFFKENLCEIHSVKPFECRELFHDGNNNERHRKVANAWKQHQNQITKLLGRKPVSVSFTILDTIFNF